jgi:hypothetical protein
MVEVNQLGQVKEIPQINDAVMSLVAKWDLTSESAQISWWRIGTTSINFKNAAKFLLGCVDELVALVEAYIQSGKDKKATVLFAVALLYDYIVAQALPIYLKPFAGKIKNLIIGVLVSELIDFIVSKYRAGAWKEVPSVEPTREKYGQEEASGGSQVEGSAEVQQG